MHEAGINISSCFNIPSQSALYRECSIELPVRIWLAEYGPTEVVEWSISSQEGLLLHDPSTGLTQELSEKELTISAQGYLAHVLKADKVTLFLLPKNGALKFNGRKYPGIFALEKTTKATYLVSHVGLEKYLECVVPYEADPTWPDEVLKVQCIAARTYALSKIAERRAPSSGWPFPYDLMPDHWDQTYKGLYEKRQFTEIVDATQGLVIAYDKKPILAMYTTVCGGVIPHGKKTSVFETSPYLKRSYACTFCKDHKLFRWDCTIPYTELELLIRAKNPRLTSIQSIIIDEYDKAGMAQQFVITDTDNKVISMSADEFRRLTPTNIRSNCCEIVPNDLAFQLKGKGWGHFIGLCQYGAYVMALQGYNYQEILQFYYPGTTLAPLQAE